MINKIINNVERKIKLINLCDEIIINSKEDIYNFNKSLKECNYGEIVINNTYKMIDLSIEKIEHQEKRKIERIEKLKKYVSHKIKYFDFNVDMFIELIEVFSYDDLKLMFNDTDYKIIHNIKKNNEKLWGDDVTNTEHDKLTNNIIEDCYKLFNSYQ